VCIGRSGEDVTLLVKIQRAHIVVEPRHETLVLFVLDVRNTLDISVGRDIDGDVGVVVDAVDGVLRTHLGAIRN
jgi:hypothetical protein